MDAGGPRHLDRTFGENARFEVLELLGSGGMGVVYAVRDRELDRTVALKTIRHAEPNALLRLKTEFRALRDLRHPNLVSLGEFIADEGNWFFTMELVKGQELLAAVRREGSPPFDEERLRSATAQLVEALMALHATGRVHRDVKPSNVMVTPEGRAVLLDFGVVTRPKSERASELLSSGAHPVGSAYYMAPEQAASRKVGPEADWYSIGAILYELLTGRPPFTGSIVQVMFAKQTSAPPSPAALEPAAPEDLSRLCVELLAPDPSQRPGGPQILERLGVAPSRDARARGPGPADVFVGRQGILHVLADAVASARPGAPQVVLLHGQSGVGKSELLRRFARGVADRDADAVLLTGRCHERERVPFKAFDSAIDDLSWLLRHLPKQESRRVMPAHAALLVDTFPVLRGVPSMRAAAEEEPLGTDAPSRRRLAFDALRTLLSRLAERRTVVLVLDDLQWADGDSLKVLSGLLSGADAPGLCVLASLRTTEDVGREGTAHFDLGAKGPATVEAAVRLFPVPPRVVEVGLLGDGDARGLARALLRDRPEGSEELVSRIVDEARGHPLFIHELARHALASKDAAHATPLHLGDVILGRVEALDGTSRRLLEAVSVAGRPVGRRLLTEVCELGRAEVEERLAALGQQQLVRIGVGAADDAIEAYHGRVREAVLVTVPRERRAAFHEAYARTLAETDGADPELMAYHLRAAHRYGEAARYAARAGARAAEATAFERAADLYAQAVAHWPEDDVEGARRVRIALGECLSDAGRGKEAASAFLEASKRADLAAERLDLERRAAEELLRTGHLHEGQRLAGHILSQLGVRLPRTVRGALLSFLMRRAVLRVRGTRFRRRDSSQIAPAQLVRVDVYGSLTRGLGLVDTVRGAAMSTRYVLAALRTGEPGRVLDGLLAECIYLAAVEAGSSRYLRHVLAQTEREAGLQGSELASCLLDLTGGQVAFMGGRWPEARDRFRRADERLGGLPGATWEKTYARMGLTWALFYLGELAEVETRTAAWLVDAEERGDRLAASGITMGLATASCVDRRGAAVARERVAEQLSHWEGQPYNLQHYYALLSFAQIDLFTGDGPRALERVERDWGSVRRSLLMQLASVRNEGLHLRARARLAAAAAAEGSARRALIGAARWDARRLRWGRLPWATALADLVTGSADALSGREAQAVATLRRAVQRLDEAHMEMYAAAARVRLAALVGGEEGRELTARAMGVMVAQGVQHPDAMTVMLAPGFGDRP